MLIQLGFGQELTTISWIQWIQLGISLNIGIFLFSIALHQFIEKTCTKPSLQAVAHPLSIPDLMWSLLTVVCNTLVLLVGVLLLKYNLIHFSDSYSGWSIVIELIFLILIMDLLMYFFHYLAHYPPFYSIHAKHHEHTSTNFLSLFVLHPAESLGFGFLMICVLMLHDFSIPALALYLLLNTVWGTIGHLNREFFPPKSGKLGIGTTQFHNEHHLVEDKNFGFYTSIWDRLFKTYQ